MAVAITGTSYTDGSVQFYSSDSDDPPQLLLVAPPPVVLLSAPQTVNAQGYVGLNPGTPTADTQTSSDFSPFNGNVSYADGAVFTSGGSNDPVSVSGSATMYSTLSGTEISASG